MLQAAWKKNDKKARNIIWLFSIIVFIAVVLLSRVKLHVNLGFDAHVFARINANINTTVAILLIVGLFAVKSKRYLLHKKIMLTAMFLSVLFLISYICHHLLAAQTRFGDTNHDGQVDAAELAAAGSKRMIYYVLLGTHIPLAGIVLPFILYSAYRAFTGDFQRHKKLVRITWPVWFYVAVSGVIVYWMIRPYYG